MLLLGGIVFRAEAADVLVSMEIKTMVGRVEKGFDWLGGWFDERGPVGIASRALENHRVRCLRLEEQARRCGLPEVEILTRVQQYEARWEIWASSQLRSAHGGYHVDR